MALQVWLPLNGNLNNQGLANVTVTSSGATIDNNGKIGKCYSFTQSQYLVLNNVPFSKLSNCTVCFWIYLASNESWLPCTGGNAGSNTGQYFLATSGGTGAFYHSQIGSNTVTIYRDGVVGTSPLSSGSWHHYCITGLDLSTWNGITINHYGTYTDWNFTGRMNDFRIYDHCLSPKEVKEISKGLVLHYKLDKSSVLAKNLVYGTPIAGSINSGTISVTDGVATINNTSGSWCRVQCQNESESNTNMANVGVTNKTITVSFDIWMISGNVPKIFISDSYRSVTGVDKNKTGVWQRAYCTYVHPGYNSSYYYFTPHFNGVNNCKIRNLKVVLGDIQDYYSGFNEGNIVYDCSGYLNNGTLIGNLSITNDTPRYNNCTKNLSEYLLNSIFDFPESKGITFACWMNLTAWGIQTSGIWATSTNSITTPTDYNTTTCNHRDSGFDIRGTNGTTYRLTCNNTDIPLNTWKYVVMTHDGISAKLYINGTLIRTLSVPTSLVGFKSLFIGWSNAGGANRRCQGSWSDFRIYVTALSDQDILELYNNPVNIDNQGDIFSFEFDEDYSSERELNPVPISGFTVTNDGYKVSGHTWPSAEYIPISPSGKTYYYDIEYSNVTGNHLYIGFERYDINKASGSNNECQYVVNTTSIANHVRVTGTINLSTANGNTAAFTKLRILNNWDNSSNVNYIGTIHYISLKEVTSIKESKIEKTGQMIGNTFIESKNASISKTSNIIGNQFMEK